MSINTTSLTKKIDFALIIEVNHANPNGDPLNGNRPRTDFGGYGEITDVCLKRKLRDRLQDAGHAIFVQSDDRKTDGMTSLKNRAEADAPIGLGKDAFDAKKTKPDETAKKACAKWFDVRAFGQVFAWSAEKTAKKAKKDQEQEAAVEGAASNANGVSIPVRGPVTIQSAFSIDPVTVSSTQITKSVSGEGDGTKRGSDTMGMKHRVDKGIYVTFGAITPQLAERTGFNDADAQIIKSLLPKLFEGDASSARPEGSMRVLKFFWWEQNGKMPKYSSARVHGSLKVNANGTFDAPDLEGLKPEIGEGF